MLPEPSFRIQFAGETPWGLVIHRGEIIGRIRRGAGRFTYYPGSFNVDRPAGSAPSLHLLEIQIEASLP